MQPLLFNNAYKEENGLYRYRITNICKGFAFMPFISLVVPNSYLPFILPHEIKVSLEVKTYIIDS